MKRFRLLRASRGWAHGFWRISEGDVLTVGNALQILKSRAHNVMQGEHEMKLREIPYKGPAAGLNMPMPLAAALEIQAGERIRWLALGQFDLRLIHMDARSAS